MKRIILNLFSFSILLAMIFNIINLPVYSKDYEGNSEWAEEILNRASNYGLITDRIKDNMSKKITREEFAELSVLLLEKLTGKIPSTWGISFSDTNNIEVYKAAGAGIIEGVGNGRFAPNDLITREQMVTILLRLVKLIEPFNDYTSVDPYTFADDALISKWAKEAVYYFAQINVVAGVGNNLYSPKGDATREQAVAICTRIFERLNYTIEVYFDQNEIKMGPIEMIDNIPYANPEPILKAIGASYQYNETSKKLSITFKTYKAIYQADNIFANFDNKQYKLSFATYYNLNEGKLYIPLPTIGKALHLNTDWNYKQAYLLFETDYNNDPYYFER